MSLVDRGTIVSGRKNEIGRLCKTISEAIVATSILDMEYVQPVYLKPLLHHA